MPPAYAQFPYGVSPHQGCTNHPHDFDLLTPPGSLTTNAQLIVPARFPNANLIGVNTHAVSETLELPGAVAVAPLITALPEVHADMAFVPNHKYPTSSGLSVKACGPVESTIEYPRRKVALAEMPYGPSV